MKCDRTCPSQCDKCHELDNCVGAVARVGDLLLCDDCARARRVGAGLDA